MTGVGRETKGKCVCERGSVCERDYLLCREREIVSRSLSPGRFCPFAHPHFLSAPTGCDYFLEDAHVLALDKVLRWRPLRSQKSVNVAMGGLWTSAAASVRPGPLARVRFCPPPPPPPIPIPTCSSPSSLPPADKPLGYVVLWLSPIRLWWQAARSSSSL